MKKLNKEHIIKKFEKRKVKGDIMSTEKKNAFLNYVSEAMLHENARKDGNGTVVNVSIPVKESKTGYGSFAVNPGQILNATKKDGTVVPGYKSVLLGAPEKMRKISICSKITKAGKKSYSDIEMTNQAVVEMVAAARKAYKDAQKAAQAQAPAEEPAQAQA